MLIWRGIKTMAKEMKRRSKGQLVWILVTRVQWCMPFALLIRGQFTRIVLLSLYVHVSATVYVCLCANAQQKNRNTMMNNNNERIDNKINCLDILPFAAGN